MWREIKGAVYLWLQEELGVWIIKNEGGNLFGPFSGLLTNTQKKKILTVILDWWLPGARTGEWVKRVKVVKRYKLPGIK